MTVKDILAQLPTSGKTCGMNISDMTEASMENWLDHALEKMVAQYESENHIYYAGIATAIQVAAVSLTLNGVDWQVVRDMLEAMEDYLI